MSCFDIAIQNVLANEGEFVDDPKDSGGATKYGISLKWLKSLEGLVEAQIVAGVITVETIQQLTREQACALYRRYFWEPHAYERIANQHIATKVFDLTVNMGSVASHRCVQWALHATGDDLCKPVIAFWAFVKTPPITCAVKMVLGWYVSNTAGK
jgi:lysozyme family protein